MSDLFASPRIQRADAADGSIHLSSTEPLEPSPPSLTTWLRQWAATGPDQPLVAERTSGGQWRSVTYAEARTAADAIGQGLLDRGLGPDNPLLVLSGNSVDQLLVTLGALTVGVPVAPVSVAYSLQSADHARLRMIDDLVRPGAVYVEDAHRFGAAVGALASKPPVIAATGRDDGNSLATLRATSVTDAVESSFRGIGPDRTAKILFTSGSTGTPKGVITTHGMLTANQQMMRQVWPFLTEERPVLVDWLPWSHTFGGNHNVNMVLANGGTLYIDEGRPAPGAIDTTLANYADVQPTMAFNVPAGYAQLVPALERDPVLTKAFFGRLRVVFNAAAALNSGLRQRLETLALNATGRAVPVTGSWGTTETAPAATSAHYPFVDARCIGVPLPGVQLKLVPTESDTYEIRVRGPHITPGYFGRPDLSDGAFDDEHYYCPGDAVSFIDPSDPSQGLAFRGRLAEDFKLATGTFVHVGAVRTALLSSVPILSDAVITGENRGEVGALAWLNVAEAEKLGLHLSASTTRGEQVVTDAVLAQALAAALGEHNAGLGSAARVVRLLVMAQPPSLDTGEITDKGYVNQRRVLANRSDLVEQLYASPTAPAVVTPR